VGERTLPLDSPGLFEVLFLHAAVLVRRRRSVVVTAKQIPP